MAEWPTTPETPVRLTTLKGCLRSFSSTAATMRAVASVPPPALHGQMIVTGRLGQVCARADPSPSAAAALAAPVATRTSRRVNFLILRFLREYVLSRAYPNRGMCEPSSVPEIAAERVPAGQRQGSRGRQQQGQARSRGC